MQSIDNGTLASIICKLIYTSQILSHLQFGYFKTMDPNL